MAPTGLSGPDMKAIKQQYKAEVGLDGQEFFA